jgi:hypothetical protein
MHRLSMFKMFSIIFFFSNQIDKSTSQELAIIPSPVRYFALEKQQMVFDGW